MKKQIGISSLLCASVLVGIVLNSCDVRIESQKSQKSEQSEKSKKQEVSNSNIIYLTQEEFRIKIMDYKAKSTSWKYLGDKPAVVDFYATWCGPCKALSPLLKKLSLEYADKINIYKVDVDQELELVEHFGVRRLPTLWFIPMQGDPEIHKGFMDETKIKKNIELLLKEK
ncbi:MAG: thioredoxin domain-containing protein [Bacteroidales bacterium]